jgi:hypothetical protein
MARRQAGLWVVVGALLLVLTVFTATTTYAYDGLTNSRVDHDSRASSWTATVAPVGTAASAVRDGFRASPPSGTSSPFLAALVVAAEGATASATDDIAVIGRQADTAAANGWAGHETLDLPANEWTLGKNDAWVHSVVERKMDVYVGSNTTWENLWDATNARPTVFGRELQQFTDAGWRWDGWYLRAPGR